MAPRLFINETNPCVTQPTANVTSVPEDLESHQALLYIVCTLLFYSLGITVGIITYLKSEREEIEEDKVLDELLMLRKDPSQAFRSEQVQAVAAHLQMLEEKKRLREAGTDDCLKSSSSFKLCLDVKSPSFLLHSRTSSPKFHYDTCPKCTKNYRPRFGSCIDRIQRLPHAGRSWNSHCDLASCKSASPDCSPECKNGIPVNPSMDIRNLSDLPRFDITCSSTPSSNCNKSIDVFQTPPGSEDSFTVRTQPEVGGNDKEDRSMDAIQTSNCVETNV